MQSKVVQLTKSKSALVVLVTAVTVAVLATGVGYAAMNKDVTVALDGEVRDVSVMGETVGDVLSSEGIEIGDRDVVVPGVDSPISDGTAVSVQFARPLDVRVDGDESRYWVTATDVTTALDQLGMRFANADLSVSRGAPIGRTGLDLDVVTAKKLTVVLAGKKPQKETISALTVGQAFDQLGVKIGKLDRIRPGRGAALEDGDRLVLTDVRRVRRFDREAIGFESLERTDSTMYVDQSRTVRSGKPGARRLVYRVTLENGEVAERKVVKTSV
ncbi:MAG: ubiquitin-like domain-containing protein, partial [Nocardioides sp.]